MSTGSSLPAASVAPYSPPSTSTTSTAASQTTDSVTFKSSQGDPPDSSKRRPGSALTEIR